MIIKFGPKNVAVFLEFYRGEIDRLVYFDLDKKQQFTYQRPSLVYFVPSLYNLKGWKASQKEISYKEIPVDILNRLKEDSRFTS